MPPHSMRQHTICHHYFSRLTFILLLFPPFFTSPLHYFIPLLPSPIYLFYSWHLLHRILYSMHCLLSTPLRDTHRLLLPLYAFTLLSDQLLHDFFCLFSPGYSVQIDRFSLPHHVFPFLPRFFLPVFYTSGNGSVDRWYAMVHPGQKI